ncbi:MAG: hypothetical protein IE913_01295 [Halothiobacillus sp.]|nr:hypothetical protein [Halothiobacillus sp.]
MKNPLLMLAGLAALATATLFSTGAFAADAAQKSINVPAVTMFVIFVVLTLFITWWAAQRTRTTKDFYAAGGNITGFQNGLALAGASAVSHDLYASAFRHGRVDEKTEMRVSRYATITLGILAIFLGIAFEKQNIAFMVGLAFAIAASANFPILFLAIYWKKLTTRGAVMGGLGGLLTAVTLVVLSQSVWVDVLGNTQAIVPYKYPAIFSMPVAFVFAWFFSITDNSARAAEERARFHAQYVRSETGIGAEGAAKH